MTKRQLDKREKKFTERNLERQRKNAKELKKEIEYNKAIIDKNRYNRNFQDKWRPYLRQKEVELEDKTIKDMERELKDINELIEITEKQLNEGVETKQPLGIM